MKRTRHSLAFCSALAISVLCLTATTAFAAGPSSYTHEVRQLCPALGNAENQELGGCEVHMESVEPAFAGYEWYDVLFDFDLHFSGDGWVWASDFETDPSSALEPVSSWLYPNSNAWPGYLDGEELVLWAVYEGGMVDGELREIQRFHIGHEGPMGGLTLTNTRLKPELATWEPHASEIIFKGAWESTDDVTIDFE